jgi:hypothetical protein
VHEEILEGEDQLPLTQRAKKQQRLPYYYRTRRSEREHVDDSLLRVPIPAPELLKAVSLARQSAAAEAAAEAGAESSDGSSGETKKEAEEDPLATWEGLQAWFLGCHGDRIVQELGPETRLQPVYPRVREDFLHRCRLIGVRPIPAYHGTPQSNVESISQRGLLIPGRHSGISVAHGSAHGKGIYTAKVGSACLSKTFCDSCNMFVCGVADTLKGCGQRAVGHRVPRTYGIGLHHRQHHPPGWKVGPAQKQVPKMLGRFKLHADSPEVRHVGDAMVVFGEARVAPLFLASGFSGFSGRCGQVNVPYGWPNGPNPNRGARPGRGGRRQTVIWESQEVVWLPPSAERAKHAINVKRRLERRRRQLYRAMERDEKASTGDAW